MFSSVAKDETTGLADNLWNKLRQEAADVKAGEPALSSYITAALIEQETMEQAIGKIIAERIGQKGLGKADLYELFLSILPEMGADFERSLRLDLSAVFKRDPACTRLIEAFLYFKGFHALQLHRFSHYLWHVGRRDMALFLQSAGSLCYDVDIHPAAKIGVGIMLDHATGIVIGETATVGDNSSILHDVTLGGSGKVEQDRHPKIGRGVMIGAGAKILGNITVGDCVQVAAGSVVLKAVPDEVTVAGVPAKIVGKTNCREPATSMEQNLPFGDEFL